MEMEGAEAPTRMSGRSKDSGVTSIVSNFGSNRMLAPMVGRELADCDWVGVAFAGGMSELRYIEARTLNVNDRHGHLIALARVMGDETLGPQLYRHVRRLAFHPMELCAAQERCAASVRRDESPDELCPLGLLDWAIDYFVVGWMGRHGGALTDAEFTAGISTRWNASGGDSNKHYRSAIDGLRVWRKILQRANFTNLTWQKFLAKCKDAKGHGIYCDPPWPDDGAKYVHKFTEADQRELASALAAFKHTKIVVRFGDHQLIRELYPEPAWQWRTLDGRTQTNATKAEVLIVRNATPTEEQQGA